MNYLAKYLGQTSFRSKFIVYTNTQRADCCTRATKVVGISQTAMIVTLMMMLNFRIRPRQEGVSVTFVLPAERRPKSRQLFARAAHAQCIENDVKSIIAGARGDARVRAARSNSGRRDRLARFHMRRLLPQGDVRPCIHWQAPPMILRQ